jgi:hypothetical protein
LTEEVQEHQDEKWEEEDEETKLRRCIDEEEDVEK